jgi:hypothetical protein
MMYKNHMDHIGRELIISTEAVDIEYETIVESEIETVMEAEEAVRTLADWRLGSSR